MIYGKTKHYSGLSFGHTRPFTGHGVSGAEGWGSRRDGGVCPRLLPAPGRGQDTLPQTPARICMAKPASPYAVPSFPMDVEKGTQ